MVCGEKKKDKIGDPNNEAWAGRAGPSDEDVERLQGFGRAEGRWCEDELKKGDKGLPDPGFVLLREVVVEIVNVATDYDCKADEYETGAWEKEEGVSETEVFKTEIDKEEEGMYVDVGIDGDGSEREQILEREEMGMRN